jgi:hypothetical protein
MMSAAITPGTQPKSVRISTIRIDPQPLSITARGGKRIDNITLQRLIGSYKDIKNYTNQISCLPGKKQLIGCCIVCIFASRILN